MDTIALMADLSHISYKIGVVVALKDLAPIDHVKNDTRQMHELVQPIIQASDKCREALNGFLRSSAAKQFSEKTAGALGIALILAEVFEKFLKETREHLSDADAQTISNLVDDFHDIAETLGLNQKRRAEPENVKQEALRHAAGAWKGLIDADKLIADIYASRRISTRPIPKV